MLHRKKTRNKNLFALKCIYVLTIFLGLLISSSSCSKDPDELKNDPPIQNNPQGQNQDSVTPQDTTDTQENPLDANILSEYLVLKQATKMMGDIPAATDGQIKMEIKDTIFVVKGYPLGNRIQFLHDPSQKVTGFNVHVSGSTFYYHVPETIEEGQYIPPEENDSTSVLVLDLDLPDSEEVDYPFTTEIVIQPVDESGLPLDEFDRKVTAEDPEDSHQHGGCNSIAQPRSNNSIHWTWDFTIYSVNGNVQAVIAPGLATPINSQGAGCCGANGNSYTTSNNPACVPNTTSPNMTWVSLELDDYSVRPFELWQIYDDGGVQVFGNEIKKTYSRATTNFCTKVAGYTFDNDDTGGSGTHDFVPGNTSISFDFPNWEGGWRPQSGSLIYTCNTMMITRGGDGDFTTVYKRFYNVIGENNPIDFYYQWKPWFD